MLRVFGVLAAARPVCFREGPLHRKSWEQRVGTCALRMLVRMELILWIVFSFKVWYIVEAVRTRSSASLMWF